MGRNPQHSSEAAADAYTGFLNDRGQPNAVAIRSYVSQLGDRSPGSSFRQAPSGTPNLRAACSTVRPARSRSARSLSLNRVTGATLASGTVLAGIAAELWNLAETGRYVNVRIERVHQLAGVSGCQSAHSILVTRRLASEPSALTLHRELTPLFLSSVLEKRI